MGTCMDSPMGSRCQSPYIEESVQQSFTLRQKQLNEIIQAYIFSPRKQHCPSGQDITSICTNVNCNKHLLFCLKQTCQSCFTNHKTCQSIQLASIVELFEAKSREDIKFISQMFKHERQLFSQIEQQRNNFLKDRHQKMIQQQYLDTFKSIITSTKDSSGKKKTIGEAVDQLKEAHRRNQNLHWQLLTSFKQKTEQRLTQVKGIQQQTLNVFLHKQTQFQLPENPHNSYFQIENSLKKVIVTFKEQDNHWYNFIRKKKIPQNTVSTFYVKQIKTTDLSIIVGIGTSAIVGKYDCAYKCKDVIAYVCGDGSVCDRGKERPGGRIVTDGEILHITVDTKTWRVLWSIGNELLASAVLEPLKSKELYLIVMAYDQGDQFEVGQI